MRYLDERFHQGLRTMQPEIDAFLRAIVAEEKDPVALRMWKALRFITLNRLLRRLGLPLTRLTTGDVDFQMKILALLQAEVSSYGGQLVFVYLLEWQRVQPTSRDDTKIAQGGDKRNPSWPAL